jgi:hypothetical protein
MFSNLFSIILSNIEKYFSGIHFLEIHFFQNSLSKKNIFQQTEINFINCLKSSFLN